MPSTTQPEHQHQSATQARAALYEWVFEQVDSDNRQWLMDEINTLALVESFDNDAHAIKQFDIAFGLIPRRIDRNLLTIDKTAKEKAQTILPGWQPWTWQLDEAARIL